MNIAKTSDFGICKLIEERQVYQAIFENNEQGLFFKTSSSNYLTF